MAGWSCSRAFALRRRRPHACCVRCGTSAGPNTRSQPLSRSVVARHSMSRARLRIRRAAADRRARGRGSMAARQPLQGRRCQSRSRPRSAACRMMRSLEFVLGRPSSRKRNGGGRKSATPTSSRSMRRRCSCCCCSPTSCTSRSRWRRSRTRSCSRRSRTLGLFDDVISHDRLRACCRPCSAAASSAVARLRVSAGFFQHIHGASHPTRIRRLSCPVCRRRAGGDGAAAADHRRAEAIHRRNRRRERAISTSPPAPASRRASRRPRRRRRRRGSPSPSEDVADARLYTRSARCGRARGGAKWSRGGGRPLRPCGGGTSAVKLASHSEHCASENPTGSVAATIDEQPPRGHGADGFLTRSSAITAAGGSAHGRPGGAARAPAARRLARRVHLGGGARAYRRAARRAPKSTPVADGNCGVGADDEALVPATRVGGGEGGVGMSAGGWALRRTHDRRRRKFGAQSESGGGPPKTPARSRPNASRRHSCVCGVRTGTSAADAAAERGATRSARRALERERELEQRERERELEQPSASSSSASASSTSTRFSST